MNEHITEAAELCKKHKKGKLALILTYLRSNSLVKAPVIRALKEVPEVSESELNEIRESILGVKNG